jgi:hypothetical protein
MQRVIEFLDNYFFHWNSNEIQIKNYTGIGVDFWYDWKALELYQGCIKVIS